MKALHIDPKSLDTIFISHTHFDHTGGLSGLLDVHHNVNVFLPQSMRGVRHADRVVHIDAFQELYPDIYTTGELQKNEQSLIIRYGDQLVIIVGCAHSGIGNIIHAAKSVGYPYALIGGLHAFNDFEKLDSFSLICPTHCTKYAKNILKLFPSSCQAGGVGTKIHLFDSEENDYDY